ncbi:MAG: hypothetical protein FWE33_07385 [Defluviitaleaceae bacterium]|nr:hypothetical protein [Defluviitaleaceae bacterium]
MAKQPDKSADIGRKALFGLKTLFQLAILVGMVFATFWISAGIMEDIADVQADTAIVQQQIDVEILRQMDIEESAAHQQSISFVEEMARQFLGLAHRDEFIFIMTD